ncbi:hypothetical protein ACSBM8_18630 [Sphingomonas sp. ASY06-1R]|uniref:hypothetical protein n=1 Tax=Sphingomonas sp. ASY06-1R TaxID=3445771 RepID=UPI003FA32B92
MKTRLIGISAVYWLGALMLLGLITILHGDCAVSDAAIQQCDAEKQRISVWGLILASVLYCVILYRVARRGD